MDEQNVKLVADQKEWGVVSKELEAENLKLASYDHTLLPLLGDLSGKKVLDYGAGPGVLAVAIQKLGGDVKVYDTVAEMREKAAQKIGSENVYSSIDDIPKNYFDFVICNLVHCIVPEEEVRNIVKNTKRIMGDAGVAYVGFCNPHIFDVPESNLDFRHQTGATYEDNHDYKKIKKEGGYEIIESHRPIEWYEAVYREAGLTVVDEIFTPEYELGGRKIKDFIIFKLTKQIADQAHPIPESFD